MQQMREVTSPFYGIPTREIQSIDPTFTYHERQLAQDNGFQAMNNVNAYKVQGTVKHGEVVDSTAFGKEPTDDSFSTYSSSMKSLQEYANSLTDDPKNQLTKTQIRELIALDDWKSFLWKAAPSIIKWGAPFVQSLYKAHVKPLVHSMADQLGVKSSV